MAALFDPWVRCSVAEEMTMCSHVQQQHLMAFQCSSSILWLSSAAATSYGFLVQAVHARLPSYSRYFHLPGRPVLDTPYSCRRYKSTRAAPQKGVPCLNSIADNAVLMAIKPTHTRIHTHTICFTHFGSRSSMGFDSLSGMGNRNGPKLIDMVSTSKVRRFCVCV